MTKDQIIESGFIKAFISEYFELKTQITYPDKDRLLFALCENEDERKETTQRQIKKVKAQIPKMGFEGLSYAYLLSNARVDIEPNKAHNYWLQKFSEEFELSITDFDPIIKAIYNFNDVSEVSTEVLENEGQFWEWYPKSLCPKIKELLSIILNERELISLIKFDIKEYQINKYWEFDFEVYEKFCDFNKSIEILFSLCQLFVLLNRLEMFNEFLAQYNKSFQTEQNLKLNKKSKHSKRERKVNFQEIVTEINNRFFRLESFMNGTITDYEYYGFNQAFTILFAEARKPENFTYDNCKMISKYWKLTEQIRVDYDRSDFENTAAYENEMFCADCNEISHLNFERIEEFIDFSTPDEIAKELRKFSITEIIETPNLLSQQNTKQKTKPNKALILFSSTEIIEILHSELKGYFQGNEAELKKALQGEQLKEFLLFPHNQNKFVEVFKRLKYNGFLLSTPKETKDWICSTFTYQYQKGNKKEVRKFNTSTVHDILTKDKGEPTKKERICIVDWLPYKSHLTRQREAEKESI